MQYKKTLATATLAAAALSAYVPSEPWSTLTPPGTYPGGTTNYPSTFGIAVQSAQGTATRMAKRQAISQINDGQIQAPTTTRPYRSTPTVTSVPYVTSYPQEIIPAVSQIHDGQIQVTITPSPSTIWVPSTTYSEVPIVPPVEQIHDGQIQAPLKQQATRSAVAEIHDGQVQASKAPEPSPKPAESNSGSGKAVSCKTGSTLQLHLEDGVLYDERGRIGSIVSNHQFQFDGPPPQAGAIYARGWSVTPSGYLALGDSDLFYQCLSGDFYNLYDESIGAQCHPVRLEVVDLVDC